MLRELIEVSQRASITISLFDAALLLVLMTACFFFRRPRVGLIVAFVFTYRWGWLYCRGNFAGHDGSLTPALIGYLVFGVVTIVLAVIDMIGYGET